MMKKIAILLCLFMVGFIGYLVVPLPESQIDVHTRAFIPEEPTAFKPDQSENLQKCQDEVFYINKSSLGYTDSEVVDERCAELQRDLANASIDGNVVEMRRLLEKGASPRSPAFSESSSDAFPPVISAVRHKQTEAVKLLLDNGADVNSHYSCCMTSQSLLMVTVSMNDASTTKLLLTRNADLGFKDQFEGRDVFDEAHKVNNPEILNMLYNACDRTVGTRIGCRIKKVTALFRTR
jgi:hypothetical protein